MNGSKRSAARFKPHRWHAAFYARVTRNEAPAMRALRRSVVAEANGTVVEIGAGTGATFAWYQDAGRVIAVEPDPFMLRRAVQPAAAAAVPVTLIQCAAESLPLADASVDTVICMLVLCTVQNPDGALAEARRVLRPGGSLRFMEHVRGEGVLGLLHDRLAPAWRHFVGGCNPNRRTETVLLAAGFTITSVRHRRLWPGIPLITGVAAPRPA